MTLKTVGKVPATVEDPRLKDFLESMRQRLAAAEERVVALEAQLALPNEYHTPIYDSGILTTAAPSIFADLTEYDIKFGDILRVEYLVVNGHTANLDHYITANNEAATGYRFVGIYTDATAAPLTSSYLSPIFSWTNVNRSATGTIYVYIGENGTFHWFSNLNAYDGSIIWSAYFTGFRDSLLTSPLKSILFSASAGTDQYDVGSRIRIFKQTHDAA